MSIIFSPLIKIYKAFYLFAYDITGNYGLSLVLLSFFTFVVLYPFNKKAQQLQNKEHKIQAVLAPQIEAIKRQYSGREQYEQLQWLYKRYGYHPLYAIRSALGFIFQIPFLTAAYYMLSGLAEIQGVSWGVIPNLGSPDHLAAGLNVLPFVMTLVTCVYAFAMPGISKKERMQTVVIGVFFLIFLYSAPSALLVFWTCNLLWSLLDSVLSEKLHWLWKYLEKYDVAISVIFALAMTICVFIPADIYLQNGEELLFGFSDILKYFIKYMMIYSFALLLIYVILPRKNVKYAYLSLLAGILLGIFLQSYVIGLNYGTFDGHEIRWQDYTAAGLVNTAVWLFCIFGSLVICYRHKFNAVSVGKLLKTISLSLLAIQCVVLFSNWTKKPVIEKHVVVQDTANILTTKNIFRISSQKNIIVFLLDAFDTEVFEEIIKKEPAMIDKLKDFTFYPDTTSVYGFTEYSLPQIFTGKIYYNDVSYNEYFNEAWGRVPYYRELVSNNYDIGMYTDGVYVHPDAPITNLEIAKVMLSGKNIKSFRNLVMFRISPHFLKRRFNKYNPNANELISMLQNQNIPVYREDDKLFYTNLRKGVTLDDKKNCFRFYHLIGAHAPYILNRNIESVKESSIYEQSVGAMKIVLEYIDQMKQKGVFDNSTFVIMADHGHHNAIGRRTLLCIKHPYEKNETIRISNEAVSFAQFLPMIFNNLKKGETKQKPVEGDRHFYQISGNTITDYKITGNAKYISSWKKEGVLERTYDEKNSDYTLGTQMMFNWKNRENRAFLGKGWLFLIERGIWSEGSDFEMIFKIKDYQKQNLEFQLCAQPFLKGIPYRTVTIYANGEMIEKLNFDNKNRVYKFNIPASVIINDSLNLRFTIDHTGLNKGGNDLGIFLQWIKINVAKK